MPDIPLIPMRGIFYRAVDPAHRETALSGSRGPGRFSRADQPTLYLSASPEGVAAAMMAHNGAPGARCILRFSVEARDICDLRDRSGLAQAGLDPAAGAAPWQKIVQNGGAPPSWMLRKKLEQCGARGLIDPSRKAPGLWHLVLFAWNCPDGARVLPLGAG